MSYSAVGGDRLKNQSVSYGSIIPDIEYPTEGKIANMNFTTPSLMLVVDRLLYRTRAQQEPLSLVDEAIEGGVTLVQLRLRVADAAEGGDGLDRYAIAQRLREITAGRVPFVVTNDLELAERASADGVLLTGDQTYKPTAARDYLRGERPLVGCYASTVTLASRAERGGADYVQAGPIFADADDTPDEGLPLLRKIKDAIHLPVIAFGGIDSVERAELAVRNGADGIAVSHHLLTAPDPRATAAALRAAIANAQ